VILFIDDSVAGGGGSATTWSPTDFSSNGASPGWTLSNGNLTAFEATNSQESIRATTGKASGKWYWEVTPSSGAGFNCAPGVRRSDSPIATDFSGGKTLCMRSTSALFSGTTTGVTSGSGATFSSGNVVMLAMELNGTNLKLWIGVNGTWTNSGNPATGANPLFTTTDLGGGLNWFPYFGTENNSASHTVTINVGGGAGFAYTIPTGFSAI
jgi:hypothetical protein